MRLARGCLNARGPAHFILDGGSDCARMAMHKLRRLHTAEEKDWYFTKLGKNCTSGPREIQSDDELSHSRFQRGPFGRKPEACANVGRARLRLAVERENAPCLGGGVCDEADWRPARAYSCIGAIALHCMIASLRCVAARHSAIGDGVFPHLSPQRAFVDSERCSSLSPVTIVLA